jgi:elongation factor G
MVAEGKDELMEKYFENGTLPAEDIISGLHEAVKEDRVFPILAGSGLKNIGTDLIMEFMLTFCPNPTEHAALKAMIGDHEEAKAITDKDHVTAYVFKTVADPFAGRLSYFKVCTGVLKNDATLVAMRSRSQERLSHLSVPQGKTLVPVNELHAGDIGVVAKLKDVLTGDTLCEKGDSVEYPKVQIPEPSIAYAIAAKSRNDEDRMGNAVAKILEEDQGLRFYRDPQTKDFLLAGSGGQHIEVIVSRLKKRYNVEVELRQPKIPYRETIRGFADVHGRHKKQTGGHGQFGDCKIKMEPLERGKGFEYVNAIFGGAVPRQFIPAIEKGILEAAERGYLAGYPVVDFKVTLYDGSYHDVDSSEMAFKIAGRKAFKLAMEQAKPVLLEPIMKVEVMGPVEFAGDLMSDMNSRRGRISGMDTKGATQIIRALVPMAEMLTYQNDLTSMTQGRASFSMEFSHYDYVPAPNAEKIIAAYKAAATGEAEEDE